MRLPSSRRSDADADVIRARLRALLEDRAGGGWVPDDEGTGDQLDVDPDDDATEGGPARLVERGEPSGPGPSRVIAPPADDAEDPDPGASPPGVGRHRAPGPTTRWSPGRDGARSLWIAGLVAALLLAGWTWLHRPRVEPVPATSPAATLGAGTSAPTPPVVDAPETSAALVVSVVGLVARPGIVTLPAGARVADAVRAAGGLLPGTDPAAVNLAAHVADGDQIAVALPGAPVGSTGGPGGSTAAGPAGGSRVDLNAAGAAELDGLPGIGPVLARRIVDHRDRHGPFRSVEQLDDVPGIGPAIAAELAELVAV